MFSRRDFLLKLGIGLNILAGAMISIPFIGYVMSSFVKILPPKWTSLGPLDKFPEGTTRLATYENPTNAEWDGEAAVIPCWVRRVSGEEFQVFAINCTHLGCPVRWFEESKLFMCPCHGGIFYEDGEHAAGPPPRGALYLQVQGGEQRTLHRGRHHADFGESRRMSAEPKKALTTTAFEAAQGLFLWLDNRLHISHLWEHTAGHPIPKSAASWFYVFGSATLLCFILQIVTGSLLAFVYVPSASEAYEALLYLTYEQDLGWYMRAMHYWGSNFMVGIMLLHMTQVYLFGAYKYPREITWMTGCMLMLCTLGMAFTGQVLRWDEDAYWGLGIGAAIMGRVPFIGEGLVNLMLGGPIIASETLSRFFSLHVFILPGTVLALVAVHLRMVLTKGINEYPKPGHLVRRETYDKEYEAIIKKEGIPFAPTAFGRTSWLRPSSSADSFLRGRVGPEGPDRSSVSGRHRYAAAPRLFVHVDLCGGGAHARVHGDLRVAGGSACRHPYSFRPAIL